jgi:hypothetical protein
MSLKRPALVLAFLSCTLTAAADTHKIDFEAAASYADLSNVYGFKTAIARTLGTEGYLHHLAFEAAFSAHFLGDEDSEASAFFGPRFSWGVGQSKGMLYAHLLGGVVQRTDLFGVSTDDPALSVGAGYDVLLGESRTTGLRFSADYVLVEGRNYPRASVGIVYRVPYGEGHR